MREHARKRTSRGKSMERNIVWAVIFFMGVSVAYCGERTPDPGSTEQIMRCEKLSNVQLFLERNGIMEDPSSKEMEQALHSADIDPEQDPIIWGLPWGRFGAVFSSPWHIKEYKKELMCGETVTVSSNAKEAKCLLRTEDRFNLNDYNKYAPYKNGRLEFTPGMHKIGDGSGYMVLHSNSPAFNKKHTVENYFLSIDDINYCSGAILSMKCRLGFMQTECILRENEEVLKEELALRKKSMNKSYGMKISSKEFEAAINELLEEIKADGFEFNGTEGVKTTSSGSIFKMDFIKYGPQRASLLDCRIYGDKNGMYVEHECKEHRF
ncbi:MAG: hypothetical protein WBO24_14720 [Nitrospirales bacterium]